MPRFWTVEKSQEPEWMDSRPLPADELRKALAFLHLTNRRFGGWAVIRKHLDRWSSRWGENIIRILDVGTGAGDIPFAISRWARLKGLTVQITGIDTVPEIVDFARERCRSISQINIERQDYWSLVETRPPYDYVLASLLLHHIPSEDQIRFLHHADRLAERGVLISDLLRSPASLAAVTAAGAVFGNRTVRHDGPLSVRRAFTLPELVNLTAESELKYLSAAQEPWFRVSLTGEKK